MMIRSKWFKTCVLSIALIVANLISLGLSHATLISPIGPGDRIFYRGKQWIANVTGDQLNDFEVIGLSGGDADSLLEVVTGTLSKKLLLGLDAGTLIPAYGEWPIDVLNAYEDSLSTGGGYLMAFKNKLVEWNSLNIPVAAVMYNQEIPATVWFPDSVNVGGYTGPYTPEQYALKHTTLIKKYKEILLQYSPSTELWVYSSAIGTGLGDYFRNGTHWDSLTTAPNAIDVCWIGLNINVLYDPYGSLQNRKDGITTGINYVKDIVAPNGKPLICQPGFYGSTYPEIRDAYHIYWNDFRELIAHMKNEASAPKYGMNNPVPYWKGPYQSSLGDTYTLDYYGPTTPDPIPWVDGGNYPARLWENGQVGNWGFNQPNGVVNNRHNKWEREFVANFLQATGDPLTGHSLTTNQTWRGDVYLIGDVVIPSGVTLTIEPGTNIYLRKNTDVYESGTDDERIEIIVAGGHLNVNGTLNEPVVFDIHDDMEEVAGASGDWVGIRQESGSLTLNHCFINHAKNGIEVSGGSNLALTNVTIGYGDTGIKIAGLNNSEQVWIENTTIIGHNSGYGITVVGSPVLTLINSTLRDNKYPVALDSGGAMEVEILNCDISNVDGNITGATALYAVNNPVLNISYSNIYGFDSNSDYTGDIYGWTNPPNGMGTGGENRGNLSLNPKYLNAVDELNTDSPLIDAGYPNSNDPDNTRINIGRYGGTTLAKASAAGGGQKLFFDDFTGGTGKWNFEQGSWSQTNNRLERTANDGGVITINTPGSMNWTNYSLEYLVNGRDGGALVRAQDIDNGVALIVRPNGNDAYWHVKENGNWGPQYEKVTVNGLQGKNIMVKVTVVGDVYTAYIDGEMITSLTNTTFSSGKVGLYSGGGTQFTWYDDVVVTSLGNSSSGGGTPTVLLDEHFDYAHGTEPAPGWIDEGDAGQVHWKVKNNEYVLESSNINVNRAYRNVSATEYILETKIRFDASEGKVIYSHGNQHELYRLDLMADSDRFRLMINDQPTTVHTTVNRNQWYDVKIEAKSGNYVKVWIDNTLTHDVSTGLSFDGWMGAGSYNHVNDGVLFDDFKVTTLGTGGGGGGGSVPFANGNFEAGNLTGWTVSGANNPWAINNTWPLHNPQYGSQIGLEGEYCAGTNQQESYTGTMTSGNFTITQPYLNFRIGGHNGPNNTDGHNKVELRLASNNNLLLTEYTPGTNDLLQKSWNVSTWNGQSVYLVCIDNHSGGGHAWISVDDFKLSNAAAKPTVAPLVMTKPVNTMPDTFTVAQNVPNPFNPETVIAYTLPIASEVSLKIYNTLGQEIRVLLQDMVSAGRHQITWDGRDAVGQTVSSGIYFYHFRAGPLDETRKMLILK